ncbi:hypothetical protein [Jatrophihabitans fulvus]
MASHRQRVPGVSAVALVVALLCSGCGSDSEGELPGENPATVAGGGHDYAFADDTPRSQWPNPCSFLPVASVRQLIGGPATAKRGTLLCAYPVGVASLPALTVGVRWVGGEAGAKFAYALDQLGRQRQSVPGLRRGDGVRTTSRGVSRIDLLVSNVYVRVQVQAVTGKRPDVADASRIAVRAAQLVAAQIR